MTVANRAEALRQLEREVTVLRRRIKRVIRQRASMIHPDLPQSCYLMLVAIAEAGPMRASDLVDTFEIDKGAVSRQLQLLLDLDLVTREQDPADGRAHLVSATDAAVEQLERIWNQRRAWVTDQLQDWSVEDLDILVAGLHRYNTALEE